MSVGPLLILILIIPLPAILLPIILYIINTRLIWLSLILSLVIASIVYWKDLLYYESRPIMLFFILAQLIIGLITIAIIKLIRRKQDKL